LQNDDFADQFSKHDPALSTTVGRQTNNQLVVGSTPCRKLVLGLVTACGQVNPLGIPICTFSVAILKVHGFGPDLLRG